MPTHEPGPRVVDRQLLAESAVIMAFAAALFGVTFTFDRVPPVLAQGIQPALFPRAVLVVLFGLAALQAVRALRVSVPDVSAFKPVPLIVYLTGAVLIAFLVAMPLIGTFPTLILFCPALALLWGERRWRLMAFSFAGVIAFIYGLFRLIMNVPLP